MLASVLLIPTDSTAQEVFSKKHIEVALRKIGHEVLLNAQDSTSRVLPILKEDGQYSIQFEAAFTFNPEELVAAVTRIVEETHIAKRYIVEVEQCSTHAIVYSFEIDDVEQKDIVPCGSRKQVVACYNLLLTILEEPQVSALENSTAVQQTGMIPWFSSHPFMLVLCVLLGIAGVLLLSRKLIPSHRGEHIQLGKYQFDPKNAVLILEDQKTELSGKEADLLNLLYASVNATVNRETMLQRVWGDEGNYIGRTLDVFISRLRSKLQADPAIKIVNARGVGYKLVINE